MPWDCTIQHGYLLTSAAPIVRNLETWTSRRQYSLSQLQHALLCWCNSYLVLQVTDTCLFIVIFCFCSLFHCLCRCLCIMLACVRYLFVSKIPPPLSYCLDITIFNNNNKQQQQWHHHHHNNNDTHTNTHGSVCLAILQPNKLCVL